MLLIVPGIVLATRWALIDAAVVLDGVEGGDARRRSSELTGGRRLRLVAVYFAVFIGSFVCLWIVGVSSALVATLDNLAVNVAIDCVGDLCWAFLTIFLAVFFITVRDERYWNDRSSRESAALAGTGRT